MKHILLFLVTMTLSFTISQAVQARDYIVGLSPYMLAQQAKEQVKDISRFLIETLEPGDNARVYDAYNLKLITSFNVPDKTSYKHVKTKFRINGKAIKTLQNFANKSTLPDGKRNGSIRIPQFMRFLGENYIFNEQVNVIVLGNPIYHDSKTPAFSMNFGAIPSDGHLFNSTSKTPFGIDNANLLKNMYVHFAYIGEDWKQNEQHGFFVKRFWRLFIEKQGGKFVTFTGDLPTLFHRIKTNTSATAHNFTIDDTDKLEMIVLKPPQIKYSPIYERPVTTTAPSRSDVIHAQNVEFGLSWDCKSCDMDLYVRPLPNAKTLYFNHIQTPLGRYWKDFLKSPKSTNGYETISLSVPVDLRSVLIAVNFYNGTAPKGINGELRISWNGKTYAKNFTIPATSGNKGQDRENILQNGKASNSHWIIIDPITVIGWDIDQNR